MEDKLQLGLVTTHPIQYQAPLFRALSGREEIDLTVYFHHIPNPQEQGEGFNTAFKWDLPLLDGYSWRVLKDQATSSNPYPTFTGLPAAYQHSDVMLIHGWQSSFMWRAWVHGFWRSIPLLVRGDSNAMRKRPLPLRLMHSAYLQTYQSLLYVGKSNKSFYRNAGINEEKLFFSPHCVENDRFEHDRKRLRKSREDIRSRFGIPLDAICFLFCGKFISKKRPLDVVRSFLKANRSVDSHLLMVGDGPLRSDIEAKTRGHDTITLAGFLNQTEIGKAYTAADVLVLPSDFGETWGLVVNEGMIFELPAIVSDRVGCGPDLVEDGKTGYTFSYGDVEALSSVMLQMARNPISIQEMGKRARQRILSEYTIDEAVEGILEATRDAVEKAA
jgi:glycosyltransferase involved in cell wall biosynthesis